MIWVLVILAVATMILNVVVQFKMLVTLDKLHVASSLNAQTQADMQAAARLVAKDLADRYVRADAVEGVPGEAADVAARSEPNGE